MPFEINRRIFMEILGIKLILSFQIMHIFKVNCSLQKFPCKSSNDYLIDNVDDYKYFSSPLSQ